MHDRNFKVEIDELFNEPENRRVKDPVTGHRRVMSVYQCKECGNYTTKPYREDHYTIFHSHIGFVEQIPPEHGEHLAGSQY